MGAQMIKHTGPCKCGVEGCDLVIRTDLLTREGRHIVIDLLVDPDGKADRFFVVAIDLVAGETLEAFETSAHAELRFGCSHGASERCPRPEDGCRAIPLSTIVDGLDAAVQTHGLFVRLCESGLDGSVSMELHSDEHRHVKGGAEC